VFEVTVLDKDELDPPPAISASWQSHSIAGIGRRNGAFVTVIDLDRLLSGMDVPPPLLVDQAA
jgi:purine-binding chemotaxis protein CheW